VLGLATKYLILSLSRRRYYSPDSGPLSAMRVSAQPSDETLQNSLAQGRVGKSRIPSHSSKSTYVQGDVLRANHPSTGAPLG
jgi:hypothetical protein